MSAKSPRDSTRTSRESSLAQSRDLLLHGHDLLDPFSVGSWIPNVDICRTNSRVLVRVELPGVDSSDIDLRFHGNRLLLRGIKREPLKSDKLFCYFCLERRYGKFDRQINIGWIVNPLKAHAYLDKGILTIELPMIKDRRGKIVEIQIRKR
jgi:HSP20 family protein